MQIRLVLRIAQATAIALTACSLILAQGGGRGGGRGGSGGMAPQAAAFDPHDLSGYWELDHENTYIPAAVLLPSVTKSVTDKYALNDIVSLRWCKPVGMPATMGATRPIQFAQGKWEILVVPEANSSPRHIYFDRPHIDAEIFDPSSVGDSVAHWEGDTLIVDTIGFHPTNGTLAIPGGGFRTEHSRLIERYKLMKNGTVLDATFTWTDPTMYRTPHSYEYRYAKVASAHYEPRPAVGCDPYDEDRNALVMRPFTPAQRAAAEAESRENRAAKRAAEYRAQAAKLEAAKQLAAKSGTQPADANK